MDQRCTLCYMDPQRTVSSDGKPTTSSSFVKSADRVLRILLYLAHQAMPTPTMALARECDIPKSSTHHLLNMMLEHHFVTYYEEERAWGLGVAAFEIGSAYLRSRPLQRLGRQRLVALTSQTRKTSHLAILHGVDVLYIDKEEPPRDVPRLITEVGVRLPAHLTSVGIAILANLPTQQVRALYDNHQLVNRTGVGPRDLRELLPILKKVREIGYAYDMQMTTPGVCCVAAPVFTRDGLPTAALGITLLSSAPGDSEIAEFAAALQKESRRLSRALGWRAEEEQA